MDVQIISIAVCAFWLQSTLSFLTLDVINCCWYFFRRSFRSLPFTMSFYQSPLYLSWKKSCERESVCDTISTNCFAICDSDASKGRNFLLNEKSECRRIRFFLFYLFFSYLFPYCLFLRCPIPYSQVPCRHARSRCIFLR